MKTRSANSSFVSRMIGWAFGIALLVIGILTIFLVHPGPGLFYLLLSLIYLPPAAALLHRRLGLSLPPAVKIVLGLVVVWGTLAMSELADMID